MKKLLALGVVAAVGFAIWKYAGHPAGDAALAELEQRLHAAERAYQSAGRAAGMSGIDSTSDAEAAMEEVKRVEQELRELGRKATTPRTKARIHQLLDETAEVTRKMR